MRCAVFYFYPMEYVIRKQKTDIRNQRTEIRRQKTDIRKQISENRRQKTKNRKQKSEIRKRETENGNQISRLWAVICLRVSDPRLPAVFFISPDGSVPEYARE